MSSSSTTTKDNSLWLKLLRQSSSRALAPEASCVLVGDVDAGKRSLLTKLGQNDNLARQASFLELVNYDFFDVDDGSLDSASKVHMWGFDERVFSQSSDLVTQCTSSSKLMFIIALDLTKGEEMLMSLKKWLHSIADFVERFESSLSTEQAQTMKEQYLQYISTVRLSKGSKLSDIDNVGSSIDEGSRAKFELAMDKFPVPIVVVGCKADLINPNDLVMMKAMKETQGKLRYLCLEAGAALFFSGKEQDQSRLTSLKRYIIHRLHPESVGMELAIEEKLEHTFIPSGFDTVDMIQISTGQKNANKDELHHYLSTTHTAEAAPSSSAAASSTASSAVAFTEIEQEQEWLQGLFSFISQVASTGESATTTKTATNLSDLLADNDAAEKTKPSSAPAAKSATTAPATTALPTRRQSVRTASLAAAGGEKKDVKDFFQNLLNK